MKLVRILISSPGDVAEERDKARRVIDELQHEYVESLNLFSLLWEDLALQADMPFQQGIELVLSQKEGVDIAVFILWARLGSPLGHKVRKPDGSEYRSGTEREFDLMLNAREQSGGARPAILAYVRHDDKAWASTIVANTNEIDALLKQKQAADQFIKEQFYDPKEGTNVRAYHTFAEPVSFGLRLRTHLKQLLDELLPKDDEDHRPVPWEGTPFRRLAVFEFEHAKIFFGRDQAVMEVQIRLREQAEKGCAFVLIVGASGSGKSSLARAGVLPALVNHYPDPAIKVWRHGVMVPGQWAGDLCLGLAHVLLEALPELRKDDQTVSTLADGLRSEPKVAYELAIQELLARILSGRLVLLVDQLEELFTHQAVQREDMERFLAALKLLASSGRVWVLATLRGDFYARYQQWPVLMTMKEPGGQYDLLAPSTSELRRMIVGPATLAGLNYERNPAGEILDLRILEDAVKHPEALPLLEYLLSELYEQRTTPGNLLTFQAYENLGGVEGALRSQADKLFNSLSEPEKFLTRQIFVQLVHLGEGMEDTRLRVNLESLKNSIRRSLSKGAVTQIEVDQLLEKLLTARLIVTARDSATGAVTLEVVHEALIRKWDWLRQWLNEDREFLLWKQRLRTKLQGWERTKRSQGDLLRSSNLVEAKKWIGLRAQDMEADESAFIQKSLQRRLLISSGLVAGVCALLALAIFSVLQQAHERATRQVALARLLAQEAARELQKNTDSLERSALLAVESLSTLRSSEADQVLRRALNSLPRVITNVTHKGEINAITYSLDGRYLVTASKDKTAQVWDTARWVPVGRAANHQSNVICVAFSPSSDVFATGSEDKTTCLWETKTGLQKGPPLEHGETVWGIAFSLTGQYLAARGSQTIKIWDMKSNELLSVSKESQTENPITGMAFAPPNGEYYATSIRLGKVRLWDTLTGQEAKSAQQEKIVQSLAFSPDGASLASVGTDGVNLWKIPDLERLWETFKGYGFTHATFSPDGRFLAIGGSEGMVGLLNATNGTHVFVQTNGHQGEVKAVAVSADSRFVATASSDNTARVWDALSGMEIARMIHDGVVNSVAFSPTRPELATASSDGTARIWGRRGYAEAVRVDDANTNSLKGIAFSDDGKSFATAGSSGTVSIWASEDGTVNGSRQLGCEVESVALSPGKKYVAIGGNDGIVRIWDLLKDEVREFNPKIVTARAVAFCTGGDLLAAGGTGETVIWTMPKGEIKLKLKTTDTVTSVAFSPDQKKLATSSADSATIWRMPDGQSLKTLDHSSTIDAVAFSHDGRFLATAGGGAFVRIWDVTSGDQLKRLFNGDRAMAVAFSPDGKYVAIGSSDNKVRVCDWQANLEVAQMSHNREVESIAFSPNGRLLGSASRDGTARLWLWRPEDLIDEASKHLTRNLTTNEWALFIGEVPYRKRFRNLP